MEKNVLNKVNQEINYILEHEDGMSKHDREELNRLLLQKLDIEKQLVHLSEDLRRLISE